MPVNSKHMKKYTNKKAIIYCRVSSHDQIQGTSLDRQQDACLEYAEKMGLDKNQVKIYIEKGESATAANRTEFLKAIEFCREYKDKIEAFIVWKIDRFCRNPIDHFAVRAKLVQYGTTLHSVTESITNDPQGKLMEVMLAGFAEFENEIRKQRCEGGMQRKVEEGIWPWYPPIGYLHSKKLYNEKRKTRPDEPDPETFPIIQKGLKEFSKGKITLTKLTELYNQWGLKTRDGKKIIIQKVDWILNNKYYAGILVNSWTGKDCVGQHQPMITPDEFNRIQEIKKRNSNLKNIPHMRLHPDFPLRRFVRCSACHGKLTGCWRTGRSKKYAYYNCTNKECKMFGLSIPKKELESKFLVLLKEVTPKENFLKLFKEVVLDSWQTKHEIFKKEKDDYDKRLKILEKQKDKLTQMRMNNELTKEEYLNHKDGLENQLTSLRISSNEAEIDKLDIEAALSYCVQFAANIPRQWQDLTDIELKARLQKLVFKNGLEYNRAEGVFSTAELSPIFALNREISAKTNKTEVVRSHLVAGAGFEPATSRLWASRAARLLYPAVIKMIKMQDTNSKKIPITKSQNLIINE